MLLESIGLTLLIALALRLALGRTRVWIVALALGVGLAFAFVAPSRAPPPTPRGQPREHDASLYVTSKACLGCHPAEHASFSRTFHRSMTQLASDATVLAPLERREGEIRAEGRKVVLTTGSHREQAYWLEGDQPGELVLMSSVWMIRERALIPREAAFITPPDQPLEPAHWRSNCIACHSVAGEPRRDHDNRFDPKVAELGVACEACHGPGAAHVARHQSPLARWTQSRSAEPDPSIVQPARLSAERSLAVCGQCHAYSFPRDEDEFWRHGYARAFRAGDTLEASRHLLSLGALGDAPTIDAPTIEAEASSIFWSDGAVRIGGRELHGVLASSCYRRGEAKLTCLSCHAMHAGDPRGQIAPDKRGDAACVSCHAHTPEHSHHAEGSPGHACVSCHMPKTSFALLQGVRSHVIDSPNAAVTLDTGRPNACNLCHVDRSLGWTMNTLTQWFEQQPIELPPQRQTIAEGIVGALTADAGVRALYADALGSDDAKRASDHDLLASVLVAMRDDPYAAVRFIAARSLRNVKESEIVPLPATLLQTLRAQRDDRPITLAE